MNSLLDLAFSLITSPKQALARITGEEMLKEGFILWIFVIFLLALSALQDGAGLVPQFLLLVLTMGLSLLIHSAVTDYISGLWGGMGTARGITAGFMAAALPMAFSVFFTFLSLFGLSELSGVGAFILFVWTFYLDVTAISENYRFRFGKSFLIALAPYILLILFLILITLTVIVAAVMGLTDMQTVEDIGGTIGQAL